MKQPGLKMVKVGREMMVAGLALCLVGAVLAGVAWAKGRRLVHVESVVSQNEEQIGGGEILYLPHFRFRTPDGQVKDVAGSHAETPADFAVGQSVALTYEPGAPGRVRVATVWAVYGFAIVCGIAGAGGFDVGVVVWWLGKRRAVARRGGGDGQRKQFAALFGQSGGYRPSDPR